MNKKKLILVFVAMAMISLFFMDIVQMNNPGSSDDIDESKMRGAFLAEYSVLDGNAKKMSDLLSMVKNIDEAWIEQVWYHGFWRWSAQVDDADSSYTLYLRFNDEFFSSDIMSDFQLKNNYFIISDSSRISAQLYIPERLSFYLGSYRSDTLTLKVEPIAEEGGFDSLEIVFRTVDRN